MHPVARAAAVLWVVSGVAWAGKGEGAAKALGAADRHTRACDIARALVKYRLVYDRTKHADVLLKIAAAQRKVGRRVAAARTYQRYLSHPGADPEKKTEVKQTLAEIDREIARLRVQAPKPGRVWVDGSMEGEGAEVHVRVDPGRHVVTWQREDAIRGAIAVEVAAGEERGVDFGRPTSPLPDPAPPETTATGDLAGTAETLKKACKLLESIDKYRAAQARAPSGRTARRLGDALERAGRPSQAADAYEESIRVEPARAKRARRRLEKLRPQIDRVSITPTVAGGRLLVDGWPVTPSEAGTVRVDPGRHVALLEKDGKAHSAAHFEAVAGGQTEVTLRRIEAETGPTAPGSPGSGVAASGAGALEGDAAGALSGEEAAPVGTTEPLADESTAGADSEVYTSHTPIFEEHAGHAGQISVMLQSDTDLRTGDTGPTVGVALGLGSRLEVSAVALTQRLKGARIAGALLLVPEPAIKPYVRGGFPIFSEDGLQAGVHAAIGVFWDFTPMTGISADLGVEHFPSMPEPYYETYVLASLGLQVRTPP